MASAVLFDLDDTLVVDERAAEEAFAATAATAALRDPRIDAVSLARDARTRARELWRAGPSYEYCRELPRILSPGG